MRLNDHEQRADRINGAMEVVAATQCTRIAGVVAASTGDEDVAGARGNGDSPTANRMSTEREHEQQRGASTPCAASSVAPDAEHGNMRAPHVTEEVRFFIVGDIGEPGAWRASVAESMAALQRSGLGATFVITTGDNCYKQERRVQRQCIRATRA